MLDMFLHCQTRSGNLPCCTCKVCTKSERCHCIIHCRVSRLYLTSAVMDLVEARKRLPKSPFISFTVVLDQHEVVAMKKSSRKKMKKIIMLG